MVLGDKILVVDDNPKVKQSVEMVLEGYRVVGTLSGGEALDLLKKPNDVDLVILDVHLSGEDGLQTLTEIKKINARLAVIILTAFSSNDVLLKALRGRADDFLEKPFHPVQLREKVEGLLAVRERDDERLDHSDRVIQKVLRLLARNVDKPVTLKDASAAVFLSPKYLSRIFRERTGKRFTEYRIALKIKKAKQLLRKTSQNIARIAERLGYENGETFMKIFKKMTGQTPTEYRKKHHPVSPA